MGTLVCVVDDSPEAEEALRVATRLSREAELRLVVVHVEDTVGAGSDIRGAAAERGRQLLDRLLATQGLNGGADRRVEVGAPAKPARTGCRRRGREPDRRGLPQAPLLAEERDEQAGRRPVGNYGLPGRRRATGGTALGQSVAGKP